MQVWCGAQLSGANGQWSAAEQPCRNTQAPLVKVKKNEKQLFALKILEPDGVAQAPR